MEQGSLLQLLAAARQPTCATLTVQIHFASVGPTIFEFAPEYSEEAVDSAVSTELSERHASSQFEMW